MLGIFKRHKDKNLADSFRFRVNWAESSWPEFRDAWPAQRELPAPLIAPELDARRHAEWITTDERVQLIIWMHENDLPASTFLMRLDQRRGRELVVECDFYVLGNDGSPIAVDTPDGFIIDRKRFTITSNPPFWPKGLPAKAAS